MLKMAKDKIIHTRVSDALYDRLSKSAKANGTTVSGYSRKVLKSSVKKIKDPFKSYDFLHMIDWIYDVKHKNPEVQFSDPKYYLKVIKKYYPFLDTILQKSFDNVIKDLKTLIKDLNKWEYIEGGFYYQFGEEGNELLFNYEELDKYNV